MSMRIFIILVLLVGVFGFLSFRMSVAQGNSASGDSRKIVPAGVVISEDYGVMGEVVEISGVIKGDVYAAGAQIFVDGIIEGDLLAVGGTVHISGEVKQNVRVAGGQIMISGVVGRNVTAVGMNVILTDVAEIKGGVVATASTVLLDSFVGKEARIGGRILAVSGTIQDDLEAAVKHVRMSGEAKIGGDFTYWSNEDASVAAEAQVAGQITKKSPDQLVGSFGNTTQSLGAAARPFFGVSSVFSTLILGLLLLKFFPNFSESVVGHLRSKPLKSFMGGITVLLLVPVVFGLLILTIVGIPLGFVLLFASSVVLYIARIFVILVIGNILMNRIGTTKHKMPAFFAGLALYSILVFIPVFGWAVSFISAIFGLGALWQTITKKVKNNGETESIKQPAVS
jgi:hypothetical protein